MKVNKRSLASLFIVLVAGLTSGAADPHRAPRDSMLENRIFLCGRSLSEIDPGEFLPGELAAVLLNDCPPGTQPCKSSCCPSTGCCDPELQVCCDVVCLKTVCLDQCPNCG